LVGQGDVFGYRHYNEAIQINPKSPLACFARGRSYLFAGSVEKALADFSQAALSRRG
jgi:hypothetical protein